MRIWKLCTCWPRVCDVWIASRVVVPEYAGSIKEEAVVDHAFDIIFALDELITYGGMNEPIPLQQVRVNLVSE